MQTLAFMADNCPCGERVAFMVDAREKFQALAEHAYRDLKTRPDRIARRVGPLEFCDSKRVIPVQAADMLAHSAFRAAARWALGIGNGELEARRPEALVGKIAYQQFYRWDGAQKRLLLLTPSRRNPDGQWVRLRPR